MKDCSKCGENLELSCFYIRSDNGRPMSQCKRCDNKKTKKFIQDNKESRRRSDQEYYKKNKERINATSKAWKAANPEALRVYRNTRRAKKIGNGGNLTASEWRMIKASWLNRCASCGTKEKISLDHIVPISLGGPHSQENVQPLCGSCNSSKGAKAYSFLRTSLQRKL